jgi:hypothetical protein
MGGWGENFGKVLLKKNVKKCLFGVIFPPICGISHMENNVYVLP